MPDTAQHDLANISLRWMIKELECSGCGLLFNEDFAQRNVSTTIGSPQPLSLEQGVPLTGDDVDVFNSLDALQPITDELFKYSLWWILEIIPTSHSFQNEQGNWVTTYE